MEKRVTENFESAPGIFKLNKSVNRIESLELNS